MAHFKLYRLKCYNGLRTFFRIFFQSFLVLLLLSLMVIWSLLLITVTQNRNSDHLIFSSSDNTLIALAEYNSSAQNNYSSKLSSSEAQKQVFHITNLAIPLLFCFIGFIAVIFSDIYWSATSGLVLFVFWILDHQLFPMLFVWSTTTFSQGLLFVGHVLHLVTWSLLLLYGGVLTLLWRLKQEKLPQPLARLEPSPIYYQYGSNYCAYPSLNQSQSNFAEAPPYYDTFPPPPTFETIHVRSTRAASNVI